MSAVRNLTPDEDTPQGEASSLDWKFVALSIAGFEQLQRREVYSTTLKIGGTAKGNLEGVLLVFTPLLTALFASALGG